MSKKIGQDRLEAAEWPAERGTPVEAAPSDEEEITDVDFGYGRSWRDIAADMDDDSKSLNEQFCAVTSADDAVRLLLDRVVGDLTNCILFRVTDNMATIWDARSSFVDNHARDSVSMSAVSDSLLELLVVRPYYGGPVPLEESYRGFFTLIGLPVPREILLIPVCVGNRLVAILYGDGGNGGTVSRHLEEHVELARRFGLALTLVVIKNKLMNQAA